MKLLAIVALVACTPLPPLPPPPPNPVQPMLGATCTHIMAVGNDAPHGLAAPPYEAQRLVGAVAAELEVSSLDQAALVMALRRLADAVAIVAPTEIADLEQVRHAAEELRTGHWTPQMHADLTRMALAAALDALVSSRAFYASDAERYRHAVTVFATALASIDPDGRLLGQRDHVVSAFREATRAVFVAVNAPAPFAVATR